MLTYDSLGAKRYLSEKYGMKVTCAFAELNKHNYADTDSAQIKNAERLNKVKRCLFKSCMDQYRVCLIMVPKQIY